MHGNTRPARANDARAVASQGSQCEGDERAPRETHPPAAPPAQPAQPERAPPPAAQAEAESPVSRRSRAPAHRSWGEPRTFRVTGCLPPRSLCR